MAAGQCALWETQCLKWVMSQPQNCELRYCWDDFAEKLKPFAPNLQSGIDADARDVSPRP